MLTSRVCILGVLLLGIRVQGASQGQETNGYHIFTITVNTSSPSQLVIDRGRLAWIDNDISSGSHFLKFYSGADILTLDSNLTRAPIALGRDHLVWNTSAEVVRAYDILDGSTSVLGDSYNPDGSQPVAVGDGLAAYARRKAGTGTSIDLHNFQEGTDTLLSAALWNTQPSIHQGQVAWVGSDSAGLSARSEIYLFDGRPAAKISGGTHAVNSRPILRDGQIVWFSTDSTGVAVMLYTGDSLLTIARSSSASSVVTGYDVSDGIAIAAVTDTVTLSGTLHVYDAEHRILTILADSNGIWSPHVSNGLVVWQSGIGSGRQALGYDLRTATTETLGAAENPVIDEDMVAWTFGDAVELRRLVSYRQLTTDGMNGWEQTKFKTIDSNRVIWGNFANDQHMRMFAWDGASANRLSDSAGTRDLVMANDGYAVWRLNADSLFYYDWVHPPVKFLDSVQSENAYTAGGAVSFFGAKLTVPDPVKYPWLYDIETNRLTQLSTDSSNAGNVLCDGATACWENLTTQRLLFYDGAVTTTISDSAIVGDYVYRHGLIVWTQIRDGVAQVFAYDVAQKAEVQVTTGGTDKYRPVTDGTAVFWFENAVFNVTYIDADLVYVSHLGATPARIHHVPSRSIFWKWMSEGKFAWVSNGNVAVFDGNVISEIAEGSSFFLNDAHTDKGYVEWRRMLPPPAQDSGNIYLGALVPHVAFDAKDITGVAPLPVTFTNRSWEGDRTYLWNFGDGTSSTEKDPAHTYMHPGVYSVMLTVSGLSSTVSERKYALVRVGSATSVASSRITLPSRVELYQNYPNPFNPTTGIRYQLSGNSTVQIVVYDILGREVAVLVHEKQSTGTHEVRFDGSRLSSGVYFYALRTGAGRIVRSMILVK